MAEFLFDEATHTYTLDGVVIPSVTEICSPITCGKYPPVGVVQQAAARGTRVHELCALYDMDALPDEIEAGLVGYVKAWAAFCRDISRSGRILSSLCTAKSTPASPLPEPLTA